nr:hypothetical protein [Microbispora rosea]
MGETSMYGMPSACTMSQSWFLLHIAFWMPVPPIATLMEVCCAPRLFMDVDAVSSESERAGRVDRSPGSC